MGGNIVVYLGISVIKVGVFIYDIVTYPIWAIIQQPWKKRQRTDVPRAKKVPVTAGLCYRTLTPLSSLEIEFKKNGIVTVDKALEFACKKYWAKHCLGTRKVLNEYDEVQPNGKIFKKYEMGEYMWLTYAEVDETTRNFGKGLRAIGHMLRHNVVILAETRTEWMLTALGCFRQNIPLCTLYATLGEDAIIHGINETEAELLITSHELMPKVKIILTKCPKVKTIIYFKDQLHKTDTSGFNAIVCYSLEEIVELGSHSNFPANTDMTLTSEDTAIIMYTSGSTGAPKGVIISHYNLVNAMVTYSSVLFPRVDDVYIAYLPLAHILELMTECMMMMCGVPMGYSTPLTMTDRSSKIKRGCKGDATELKPTLVVSVPLILDRIYKGILEKVAAQGPFLQALFDFGFQYRKKWVSRGWDTPFCNWFVFRKVKALLGGRVRSLASGGAPLSPDTHEFIKVAMGAPLIQGYGLTESCACATLMDVGDPTTGRVGPPLTVCDIKLIDWEEGDYRIRDRPNPRGEIVIGGSVVAVGYYKNPEKTKEDFFEMDGMRWFKTGDIGEFDPDGSLKIIDRKKDLLKLQFGEYVSLGKVEAELKVSPLVENICVYGESTKNSIVAIVSPNPAALEILAKSLGKGADSLEAMCRDPVIANAVLVELCQTGRKARLQKFEFPTAIYLTPEIWTPETGLVTAAFKLKRKTIQNHYQEAITRMYGA